MGKKAVVLGGGGSRGSYQVGVWKALLELGFDYEIVTVYILPTLLPGKAPCCLPGKHGSQRTVRSLFWSE